MEARKLKCVVLTEEILSITGNTYEALILSQLIYWQKRVSDYDKFIEEEKQRAKANGKNIDVPKTNGWIYKTATELASESLVVATDRTIRSYLLSLEDKGFISSRRNPEYKFDKTMQYRVNIDAVIKAVKSYGYDGLSGWSCRNDENEKSNRNNFASSEEFDVSTEEFDVANVKNFAAIPYTTTYTTTDINKEKDTIVSKENNIFKEIVDFWNENDTSFSKVRQVTSKVKASINARLKDGYSVDDIKKAFLLCESLGDFYKGKEEGKSWKADFYWLINNTKNNFDKILAGDLHTTREQKLAYNAVMNNEDSKDIYLPCLDSSVRYNETENYYYCFNHLDFSHMYDGYTDDNRPDGATVHYLGTPHVWNKSQKKWIEQRGNK